MIKLLIKIILLSAISLIFIILMAASTIQIFSRSSIKNIYEINEIRLYGVVLGASVYSNGRPSPIYIDRLRVAKYLYDEGMIRKIIISGFANHADGYNELIPAKNYLKSVGVNEDDILLDEEGNDTFSSLINYKNDHDEIPLYLITQNYHLYRGVFISKIMNIDTIGVNADINIYADQESFILREYFANLKILIDYINYKYEIPR